MSLTAAVCGVVVIHLFMPVMSADSDWGVTYTSTRTCVSKGSTVEISSRYTYPPRINGHRTTVLETFWFIKVQDKEPVDVRRQSEFAGRVEYDCKSNTCTLRITDVRESDSAEFRFRFITNQPDGSYTGSAGVTLTVTGFQVRALTRKSCLTETCTYSTLQCLASCDLGQTSYIWYKNGQEIKKKTSLIYPDYFYPADSYSCAVKGHEDIPSHPVCGHGSECSRVWYPDRSICAFRGSSVQIRSTYNSHRTITSKLWFIPGRGLQWQSPSQPATDSQYGGRVQVLEPGSGRSTLRISDLRQSDSAQYRFRFTARGFDWGSSLPGTTLTVTESDLQVLVVGSATGPELMCHSSCLTDRVSFVWYKNGAQLPGETSPSYAGAVGPADSYSCAYEGHRSPPVYAPQLPSVSVSSSGEIVEGSSVTLTCSSDANPAAKYTWYKENGTLNPVRTGPQLVFSSIQSSDSGQYYCRAENKLGRSTSEHTSIHVRYVPRPPSVSVSPSGEIVEGSSVTLTCSSDANPAAKYTWYKENQQVLQGPTIIYHSISSEDRGVYYCQVDNLHGRVNSPSLLINVQYAPKPPSVSVSSSGEIVEGSSVTLTCSSDANPAANYTWYKENEDSPKASGQNFTITDFRAEHSGNYYCEAQNERGGYNSPFLLIVVADKSTLMINIIRLVLVVVIPIPLLLFHLCLRKMKRLSQLNQPNDPTETVELREL
ncbi:uncharacterized protein V6R79_002508 [Siganus canaliculatus]